MINQVKSTIEKYHMADKSESLLCCLSGGADSVALLLCMHEIFPNLRACHVNHQLRGEESLRDERFCTKLCERLEIPLTVKRINAKEYAENNGLSLEEGARILRYRIFDECGCDKIATAHTLSDCIETTIFNLTRGTGITGLASVPPVRGNIIRPLIECTRDEVEHFLNERGQDWVTDSTNLTDDYTRNKIRHLIVPRLREINGSLEKTMRGTLENLREDSAALRRMGDELYENALTDGGLSCEKLLQAEPALSGRAIKRLLDEKGAQSPRATVERIREICKNGGKVNVGEKIYAYVWHKTLYIEREENYGKFKAIKVQAGEEYIAFGKRITIEKSNFENVKSNINKNLTKFIADYDKINGEIFIRGRADGDKIKLIGRGCTQSVKKLLQSEMPTHKRNRTVMLCDSEGLIFIDGIGFAERVKTDKNTKTVLICKISSDYHN